MKSLELTAALRVDQSYNLGCECAYIGSLILDPSLIKQVNLCSADFYFNLNRELFHEIVSQERPHDNLREIAMNVSASNDWEFDGILDYLKHIVETTNSVTTFKANEDIIREKSVARNLEDCKKVLEAAKDVDQLS